MKPLFVEDRLLKTTFRVATSGRYGLWRRLYYAIKAPFTYVLFGYFEF